MPAATGGFQWLETFLHLFPKKFLVRPLTSVKPANAGQGITRKDGDEQREMDHIIGQAVRTPAL